MNFVHNILGHSSPVQSSPPSIPSTEPDEPEDRNSRNNLNGPDGPNGPNGPNGLDDLGPDSITPIDISNLRGVFYNSGITASLPPANRPTLNTFGVELEFFVAAMFQGYPNPMADKIKPIIIPLYVSPEDIDKRVVGEIGRLLTEHDFRMAFETDERHAPNYQGTRKVSHMRPDILPTGDEENKMGDGELHSTFWTVGSDGSLYEDWCGGHGIMWVPCEISSPAMWEGEAANRQVQRLIMTLRKNLAVRINGTCGLHVHVGYGHVKYTLDALRKSTALLWALEPMLLALHAEGRGDATWSRRMREERQNEIARGRDPADSWAAYMEAEPGEALRALANGRQREFQDYGMDDDDDRALGYALALGKLGHKKQTRQRYWLQSKVDLSHDPSNAFREIYGNMANDIMALHGVPFDRLNPKVSVGWPERGVDRFPELEAPPPMEEDQTSIMHGRPKFDLYQLNDARARAKGYYCHDTDVNVVAHIVGSTDKNVAYAHKRINDLDKAYQAGNLKPVNNMADPIDWAPPPIDLIPLWAVPQPVDWMHLRNVCKANHLRRPLVPSMWPREKYYAPDPVSMKGLLDAIPEFDKTDVPVRDTQSMWAGVNAILSCDVSAEQVSRMVKYYDTKYSSINFLRVSRKSGGQLSDTLEFRMGSPSLNPGWVTTWANIVTAIVGWAGRSNYREYMHVLRLISLAQQPSEFCLEGSKPEYDLVAFLEDIGELELAKRVVKRLEKGREAMTECYGFIHKGRAERETFLQKALEMATEEENLTAEKAQGNFGREERQRQRQGSVMSFETGEDSI